VSELSLQVIDNFLPDFYAAREYGLSLEYGTQMFQGEAYPNVSPDWGKYPTQLLSEAFGSPVQTTLSLFRYSTESSPGIDIHSDLTVDGAEWASVLYMSTPEQDAAHLSGTAFFRHKETGLRSMGPIPLMKQAGLSNDIIEQIHKDGSDETKWKLEGFVSMKSNRLVLYPCSVFHSKFGENFGVDKETGRLIWVSFFRGV